MRNDGEVSVGLAAGSSGAVNLNGGELRTTRLRGGGGHLAPELQRRHPHRRRRRGEFPRRPELGRRQRRRRDRQHRRPQRHDLPIPRGPPPAAAWRRSARPAGRTTSARPSSASPAAAAPARPASPPSTPATGAITGISITNPGVGYTSAPTVELIGGGGSGGDRRRGNPRGQRLRRALTKNWQRPRSPSPAQTPTAARPWSTGEPSPSPPRRRWPAHSPSAPARRRASRRTSASGRSPSTAAPPRWRPADMRSAPPASPLTGGGRFDLSDGTPRGRLQRQQSRPRAPRPARRRQPLHRPVGEPARLHRRLRRGVRP